MSFSDYAGSKFVPYLLPIIPRDATLSPTSKLTPDKLGKIPGWRSETGWVGFAWQKHRTPESQLAAYDKMYGEAVPTIGVQAERLPGMDIDVPDADVVEEIVKIAIEEMGNAPRRGRENSARVLMMYRLADGEQPLRKVKHVYKNAFTGEECAIEFLAAGQQYLIEGMHSSGVPYTWEGGLTPLFYGVDDLSPIQGENVDRFFARADETMLSLGWARAKGGGSGQDRILAYSEFKRSPVGRDHPDICPDIRMLEDILTNYIPASLPEFESYDAWANCCVAIVTACAGDEEHYGIFEAWSNANPDNVELTREKWESVRESAIGWSYLCNIAHDYNYTADATELFGALPDDPDKPNQPAQPAGPPPAGDTEQALADQFVLRHARKDLIYIPARGAGHWRRCTEGIWSEDFTAGHDAGAICRIASNFIRASGNASPAQLARAQALMSAHSQNAVLGIAKSHPSCSVKFELLDSAESIMGVPGGYIDLEGKLRDPDPSLLLTRTTGCRPDFDAKCPMFDGLVRSLANGDKDVEECLWGLTGYTACGLGTEQKFPFLHGEKGNEGKTTFFTILAQVFGGYGRTFKPEIFMKSRNENQFAWGPFNGAWFIYGSEIAKGAEWNDTGLKTATGGGTVTAEKKYLDQFEMWIRFMPWFSANNLPHFRGRDEALKRRMLLFHCQTKLDKITSGWDLRVFQAEGPAILAKIIRYRQAYLDRLRAGVESPLWIAPKVQEWIDAYFDEGDIVGSFIDTLLVPDPAGKVTAKEVYSAFRGFASDDEGKEHVYGRTEFYRQFDAHPKLVAMGGKRAKVRIEGLGPNQHHAVVGVALRSASETFEAL
jgi:P4 family phage/plasmid primase-like protien